MPIDYRKYRDSDLPVILRLCVQEGWPSFPEDPARAARALTAPGVTTMVACAQERVVAFAQLLSDGEIQAHLSLIAVDKDWRRHGIGRELMVRCLAEGGGKRIDLVTDSAPEFYSALPHRRMDGYRIFPPGES